MAYKKTPRRRASARRRGPDDIGGLAATASRTCSRSSMRRTARDARQRDACSALEAGIVRGVRRESGVPRSSAGGGADAAAARILGETRTPGAHLRVTFDQPDHPIAYGYPAHARVPAELRRLLDAALVARMAYCTTCLDGPYVTSGVVMEWGDATGRRSS